VANPSAGGSRDVHPDHRQLLRMLDESQLRLPHYLAWALSCGGTLLDGASVFMLGIAIPMVTHDMALGARQVALLGAALVAGAVAGASVGGRLADHLGRKAVFLMDIATYGVGMFTPVLLAALHAGSAAANPTTGLEALAAGTGELDLFLLLGFLLGIWAVARVGRIRMQLAGFGGMALGMGMLFASTALAGGPPGTGSWWPRASCCST